MSNRLIATVCCLWMLANTCFASSLSIGQFGMNASPLHAAPANIKGMDIAIGQVEGGRPGKDGVDTPANRHDDVVPTEVFRFNQAPDTSDVRAHPEYVAGVMISKNTGSLAGVAPEAKLYSSASPTFDPEDHLRSLNHIASRNSRDVRAINMSYGLPLGGLDSTDGNSYFTRGVDWLSTAYENTLFVIAGNEGGGIPLPTDSYNGLVVGSSNQEGDYFRRVSSFNSFDENPTQDRTAIGLIAPGEGFPLTALNSTSTTPPHPGGTSIAAPHVTGTVAMIQELGERNLTNIGGDHWTGNHRRHEVSKAILLNSADKLAGVHGSARTVISNDALGNYTWETSLANSNDNQPLDIQFGAGHLNAVRAVAQMGGGEWNNGSTDLPLIGWDFAETGGVGSDFRYTFENDLPADQWIAITLTWDRQVFKTGSANSYSPGDMFSNVGADNGLNNLDLFLVPEGSTNFDPGAPNTLRSVAEEQNVEHIFAKIPANGSYDIVVRQVPGGPENDVEYGLAWWFGDPFEPTIILGDFNNDQKVDDDDLDEWKSGFGTDYDGSDFLAWQRNYGYGVPASPAAATVPEPAAWMLAVIGLPLLLRRLAI